MIFSGSRVRDAERQFRARRRPPLQIAILCAIFLFAAGCGKNDTIKDESQRVRDRDTEKTQLVYDEYKKAEGVYLADTNQGRMKLEVKVAWIHEPDSEGAGGALPQPALAGVLSLYPQVVMSGSEPLQVSVPIESGTYSDLTHDLTLVLKSAGQDSRMVCQMKEDAIPCQWYTSKGTLELSLKRSDPQSALNAAPSSKGTYRGRSSEFAIEAVFQTVYSSPSSGQGVQALISARFTFVKLDHGRMPEAAPRIAFTSLDGTYDPMTRSITLTVEGESPILVNCVINDGSALACKWNSIRYFEFNLTPASADPPLPERPRSRPSR